MRRLLLAIASGTALLAATDSAYIREVEAWRQKYEAGLKAPSGWLAVAGLTWLHEGANTMGSDAGSDVVLPAGAPPHTQPLILKGGVVTYEGRTLNPDVAEKPDVLKFGEATLTIILRKDANGNRIGARLRDPNAATRKNFTGSHWYPIDPKWRVEAKWVPEPKTISIVNILGMKEDQPSPGYAEFKLAGKTIRLEPVVEKVDGVDQLFFIFKDQTSGKTTYGAGRYLYTDMPKNGKVVLEFNDAKNPPCAFTAFATCPLPPKQNAMPIALECGEKKYGSH